jgi:modulator of FtsH protease
VNAYALEGWHDYFVAGAGAAAALTGLLFVSISINLQQILESPSLPRRAVCTLSVLVVLLVAALFCLAPGQSRTVLAIELATIGVIVTGQILVLFQRSPRSPYEPRWARPIQIGLLLAPTMALVVGGISLAVETGGGLYWIMAAFALGFVGATANAWVFLVEIQR